MQCLLEILLWIVQLLIKALKNHLRGETIWFHWIVLFRLSTTLWFFRVQCRLRICFGLRKIPVDAMSSSCPKQETKDLLGNTHWDYGHVHPFKTRREMSLKLTTSIVRCWLIILRGGHQWLTSMKVFDVLVRVLSNLFSSIQVPLIKSGEAHFRWIPMFKLLNRRYCKKNCLYKLLLMMMHLLDKVGWARFLHSWCRSSFTNASSAMTLSPSARNLLRALVSVVGKQTVAISRTDWFQSALRETFPHQIHQLVQIPHKVFNL